MRLATPAAIATCATLALGAAACGSDSSSSSGGSKSASSSSTPKPAAQIDQLSGRDTAVALDGGFVKALTSLKLTPAPVGDAKISSAGTATFPITGGNVTYYKPGTVSPYVQGKIDHSGSGFTLHGGGNKVPVKNIVIAPRK